MYQKYWGKSDKTPGSALWRPYTEHVAAVALCADQLLRLSPPLLRVISEALRLSVEDSRKLILWAAVNHDLGKLHAAFQYKNPSGFHRVYPQPSLTPLLWAIEQKRGYWHGTGGYLWTKEIARPKEWKSRLEFLLQAACAHHGSYASESDRDAIHGGSLPGVSGLAQKTQKTAEVQQDNLAMREFFTEVTHFYGVSSLKPAASDPARVSLLVAGLIATADWLGSNEDFFPLQDSWALRTITEALQDPLLGAAAASSAAEAGFRALPPTFGSATPPGAGFSPLQKYAGTLGDARFVVIEAPTGDGKTEAALNLAQRFLQEGTVDRLVFSLPTKATATAMWSRVANFAREVFGEGTQVALAHGDAFRALNGLRANMGDWDASTFGHVWFRSGKRKLLSPVSVGTIDQILTSALRGNRHHFVRSFALASAVTIVDEVHAVDIYMGSVLCDLLENIAAMGGRVILLSATLSPSLRKILVGSFQRGRKKAIPNFPSGKGFPLITSVHEDGSIHQRVEPSRRADRDVEISLLKHDWENPVWPSDLDEADVVRSLAVSVQKGATCCWVRNTVAGAQKAYTEALRILPADKVLLLHAGLRMHDRRKVETKILKVFGPGGMRDKTRTPMLVIGTQILEQSLDLDFDRLVRDFAPVDSLVQALGRSHRHPWNLRPVGLENPKLEVFFPKDFLGGTGDIYRLIYGGSRLPLAKTWEWLSGNSSLREPSGVPDVIEEVYDLSVPQNMQADASADKKAKNSSLGQAGSNQIKFGSLTWGVDDGGDKAPTRLGDSGRGFYFLVRTDTPGVLQVSHAGPLLDLRPFAGLDLTKEAKRLRWDLKTLHKEWWNVTKDLPDFACGRSGFPEGCIVRGQTTDPWVSILERLLQVDERAFDNAGSLVILLDQDDDLVQISRTLPGTKPYTTRHMIGYGPTEGMVSEKA